MVMLVVLKRNNKYNKIFFPCNCDGDGEGYSLKIVMETVVVAIVFNHILSDLCLDYFFLLKKKIHTQALLFHSQRQRTKTFSGLN